MGAVSQRVGAQAVANFFIIIIHIKTGKHSTLLPIDILYFSAETGYFLSNPPKQLQIPYKKCKRKQNDTSRIYVTQT